MTRLRHYDNLGTARFITFSCYRGKQFLANRPAKALLIKHLNGTRKKHRFKLWAYVIMPEHVHLVMLPPDEMKMGLVIREIKSLTAREYFALTPGKRSEKRVFWKKRCYDHNCRSEASVMEKIAYCHKNPVVRGLVAKPENYQWSSYNWYRGMEGVPLAMDEIDFVISGI